MALTLSPRYSIRVSFGKVTFSVLPLRAAWYFALSLTFLISVLLVMEKIIIPGIEDQGKLAAAGWINENAIISANTFIRNSQTVSSSTVWESKGFQVPVGKNASHRILIMGDSYVFGDGVSNVNDIWWRKLQEELKRRGYRDVEVIADGFDGLSTHDELKRAEKIIPRYKPDIVIWGYVANDPDESIVKQLKPPPVTFFERNQFYFASVFPNLSSLLNSRRSSKLATALTNEKNGYTYGDWELKILESPNVDVYRKTLMQLGAFIRRSDIPQFVMTLPNSPDAEGFAARYGKVKPIFDEFGIVFYDILDDFLIYAKSIGLSAFRGAEALKWCANPANGHPGSIATQFYAVKAANYLERQFPGALGQKTQLEGSNSIRFNDWVPANLQLDQPKPGEVRLKYPMTDELMLRMPIRKPYIQLNLEQAADIADIRVQGAGLKSAEVIFTAETADGHFDDGVMHRLGTKSGTDLSWDLSPHPESARVFTVRIAADVVGNDRDLVVTMAPKKVSR